MDDTAPDFNGADLTLAFGILLLVAICMLLHKCESSMIEDDDMPMAVAQPLPEVFECPHCEQLIELPFLGSESESEYTDDDDSFA